MYPSLLARMPAFNPTLTDVADVVDDFAVAATLGVFDIDRWLRRS
jgi:hypothetical protein